MFSKVHLSKFEWIFMPINLNENHWVLLVANVPKMLVTVMDSLNKRHGPFIEKWKAYMKKRADITGRMGNGCQLYNKMAANVESKSC